MELLISNVSKQYGKDIWGLRDFTLRLGPGVLGLLGPNGAGKSTLMRIIATITRPTTGTIRWNGADTRAESNDLRRVLGYLPREFGVYPNLNAVEFLTYLTAARGLNQKQARRRIDELIQLVNLTEAACRPIGRSSGGMRQGAGLQRLALGLVGARRAQMASSRDGSRNAARSVDGSGDPINPGRSGRPRNTQRPVVATAALGITDPGGP